MKLTLKSVLACLSLALFGTAIGMFALSFANYEGVISGKSQVATGFEIAFGQSNALEDGKGLGTLFAFIFVVVGALAACYGLFVALTAKKSKKGDKNLKLICAACTFVVCGVVPAILLFLTLQTTGWAGQASVGGKVLAQTKLGIGAILSAIFSLVGACSLSVAELK